MQAGLDVARINFSHGTHEEHAATIALVRACATELTRPVAILGDLQGPRIRVGDLASSVELRSGDDIVLVPEGLELPNEIPVTYEALANDVHVGDRVLMDDGLIDLVVLDVEAPRVRARVVHGGVLRSHKGLNLPGSRYPRRRSRRRTAPTSPLPSSSSSTISPSASYAERRTSRSCAS
jgi:pyruvate kinase